MHALSFLVQYATTSRFFLKGRKDRYAPGIMLYPEHPFNPSTDSSTEFLDALIWTGICVYASCSNAKDQKPEIYAKPGRRPS